jgi:hypothetical protein
MLVDTTGDLDLFKRAGAPCIDDLNWLSFMVMQTNLDIMRACLDKGDIGDLIEVKMLGTDRDGLRNPPGVRRYTVESGEEVTEFIRRGRRYLLEYLKSIDLKKRWWFYSRRRPNTARRGISVRTISLITRIRTSITRMRSAAPAPIVKTVFSLRFHTVRWLFRAIRT